MRSTQRATKTRPLAVLLSCACLLACNAPGKDTSIAARDDSGSKSVYWPRAESGVAHDPKIEARIDALLSQMKLEHKIGQMVQPDIRSVTPEQVRTFRLGSVL